MNKPVTSMEFSFHFSNCSIFMKEICISDEAIHFKELKYCLKDNPTILNRTKKPTESHINPNDLLPDSEYIKWVWSTEKTKNSRGFKKLLMLEMYC